VPLAESKLAKAVHGGYDLPAGSYSFVVTMQ